ncbi:hypothetical protein HY490_03120 [Candidatus Woesearchaeota archaeon]|nr:hypothetical protein [Candidatus Woesearchaeota archaeon]
MDENKLSFVVLGVVALIAVIGLALVLGGGSSATGKIVTMAGCDSPSTPVLTRPGENPNFLPQWTEAKYTCDKASGVDDYGYETWCCTPPANVPVSQRYKGVPILGYD